MLETLIAYKLPPSLFLSNGNRYKIHAIIKKLIFIMQIYNALSIIFQFFWEKLKIDLYNQNPCSTFAPAFGREAEQAGGMEKRGWSACVSGKKVLPLHPYRPGRWGERKRKERGKRPACPGGGGKGNRSSLTRWYRNRKSSSKRKQLGIGAYPRMGCAVREDRKKEEEKDSFPTAESLILAQDER